MSSLLYLPVAVQQDSALEEVCRELQAVARSLRINVQAEWQGVTLVARPDGNAQTLLERADAWRRSEHRTNRRVFS